MTYPRVLLATLILCTTALFYGSLSGPGSWPPTAEAQGTLGDFRLRVEIDGIVGTSFRGVDSWEISTEVREFREAGGGVVTRVPGATSYGSVTLRFGPDKLGDELWRWYSSLIEGGVPPHRSMSIILVDNRTGRDTIRYDFSRCWPTRWLGPRQVSSNTAVPLEEVTITYQSMSRERA